MQSVRVPKIIIVTTLQFGQDIKHIISNSTFNHWYGGKFQVLEIEPSINNKFFLATLQAFGPPQNSVCVLMTEHIIPGMHAIRNLRRFASHPRFQHAILGSAGIVQNEHGIQTIPSSSDEADYSATFAKEVTYPCGMVYVPFSAARAFVRQPADGPEFYHLARMARKYMAYPSYVVPVDINDPETFLMPWLARLHSQLDPRRLLLHERRAFSAYVEGTKFVLEPNRELVKSDKPSGKALFFVDELSNADALVKYAAGIPSDQLSMLYIVITDTAEYRMHRMEKLLMEKRLNALSKNIISLRDSHPPVWGIERTETDILADLMVDLREVLLTFKPESFIIHNSGSLVSFTAALIATEMDVPTIEPLLTTSHVEESSQKVPVDMVMTMSMSLQRNSVTQ